MLVCLVSAKGAPGTTTSALALTMTWPQPVLLLEADPAGGDLRTGFLGGGDGGRNLAELAARSRHGLSAADIAHQCIPLEHDETTRLLIAGAPSPFAGASLDRLWKPLLAVLPQFGVRDPIWVRRADVLVDCGHLDHPHMPWSLIESADLVVLVVRSTLRSVAAASQRVRRLRTVLADLRQPPQALAGLLIAEGDYTAAEVGDTGINAAATLAYDPAAARVLSDGARAPRGFHRGQYMRSARAAAARLHARSPHTENAPPHEAASAPSIPPHEQEHARDGHAFVHAFSPFDDAPLHRSARAGLGGGPSVALRSRGAPDRRDR